MAFSGRLFPEELQLKLLCCALLHFLADWLILVILLVKRCQHILALRTISLPHNLFKTLLAGLRNHVGFWLQILLKLDADADLAASVLSEDFVVLALVVFELFVRVVLPSNMRLHMALDRISSLEVAHEPFSLPAGSEILGAELHLLLVAITLDMIVLLIPLNLFELAHGGSLSGYLALPEHLHLVLDVNLGHDTIVVLSVPGQVLIDCMDATYRIKLFSDAREVIWKVQQAADNNAQVDDLGSEDKYCQFFDVGPLHLLSVAREGRRVVVLRLSRCLDDENDRQRDGEPNPKHAEEARESPVNRIQMTQVGSFPTPQEQAKVDQGGQQLVGRSSRVQYQLKLDGRVRESVLTRVILEGDLDAYEGDDRHDQG